MKKINLQQIYEYVEKHIYPKICIRILKLL